MKLKNFIIILFFIIGVGCQKGEKASPQPEKAILTFPIDNTICLEGNIISNTESSINFTWNSSNNTDAYEFSLKNLITGVSLIKLVNTTNIEVSLLRNTPYSWFVSSISTKNAFIAKSDTWKFYNSGPGSISYSPFPAEIIAPKKEESVQPISGNINLEWKGSDVDGDIINYDIYFGSSLIPPIFISKTTYTTLKDVPVKENITYYWKVITRDSKGNLSDSGLYQFVVK
ncbi:hypothetical protein SAMN05421813_1036 [Daejeonella rubra]|uniref:Fibronectin type-III domain-containing protein n=1 Tax=Daejeonella rubra TaxID=990371 RepID=A0A1G9NG02_9SPHI|nr:hypothetical protein [Daejeonella rubra]SDL84977.1 hypothetical protein SAMN05421813_1036 [Daejeonella rubra]